MPIDTGNPDKALPLARQRAVKSPFPNTSLCAIGRTVRAQAPAKMLGSKEFMVSVAYRDEDLGWVDASSLRLFEIDKKSGTHFLVPDSWADLDTREVKAIVSSAGMYTAIGLPVEEQVLAFVQAVATAADKIDTRAAAWHHPLCTKILCAGPSPRLPPPGGVSGSACTLCLGLHMPVNLLPEVQLLRPPVVTPVTPVPPPPSVPPRQPMLYLLCVAKNIMQLPATDETFIEAVDIRTWTSSSITSVGPFPAGHSNFSIWADSLGLIIALNEENKSILYVSDHGQIWSLDVGAWIFTCQLSSDGKQVWLVTISAIVVVNVVTRSIERMIRPSSDYDQFGTLSLSPDGLTMALVGSAKVILVNIQTGNFQDIGVPGAQLGAFINNTELLLSAHGNMGGATEFVHLTISTGAVSRFPGPTPVHGYYLSSQIFTVSGKTFFDFDDRIFEIDIAAATYQRRLSLAPIILQSTTALPGMIACAVRGKLHVYDVNAQTYSPQVFSALAQSPHIVDIAAMEYR